MEFTKRNYALKGLFLFMCMGLGIGGGILAAKLINREGAVATTAPGSPAATKAGLKAESAAAEAPLAKRPEMPPESAKFPGFREFKEGHVPQ